MGPSRFSGSGTKALTPAPACGLFLCVTCWLAYLRACVLSRFSCVRLFVTPWTVTCQTLLSLRFPRQEYWSGLPVPSPEDLPDPEIKLNPPEAPALQVDSLPLNR